MTLRPGLAACLLFTTVLTGCQSIQVPFVSEPPAPEPVSAPAEPVVEESVARPNPASRPASADLNWEPELDQPISQLEAQLEADESQLEKNHTLSSIAYLYDAGLYLLFQDTLDYLPEQAQRHEVELQNRWLDQRAQAMTQAFLEDADGEVARFKAGQVFIEETRKRITELERLRELVVIE